jgi:hypothetical protein
MAELAELAALRAVLEEDYESAVEILEESFPSELKTFAGQVGKLGELIDEVYRRKGAR